MFKFVVRYNSRYEREVMAESIERAEEEASIYAAESGMDREMCYTGFEVSDQFEEATLGTFTNSPDYFRKLFGQGEFRAQRVVAAACRSKCLEYTLVSARHWDKGMNKLCRQLDLEDTSWPMDQQGFIDQYGNFLTREQAYIIAKREGQIIRDCNEPGVLYSENIY